MQTGSSETLFSWKSGQTTYVPLWDRIDGAWPSMNSRFSSKYTQIRKRICFLSNFLCLMAPFCVQSSKVHAEEEDSNEGSSTQQIQLQEYSKYVQHTLQRRLELCVPKNQTARPCSQFPFSYIRERFIHSQDRPTYIFCCSQIGRPILEIYQSLTDI
jgi:hypothetical protein